MTDLSDVTSSGPLDPAEDRVHDDNYVLNELKRLFIGSQTPFDDFTVVDRNNQIDISSDHPVSAQRDRATDGVTHQPASAVYRIRANATVESLETLGSLRYVPGYVAEVGIAIRIPTAPTGGQEVRWGYWDGSDGVYWGWDATGVFVEFLRGGARQGKIRDLNGQTVDLESALQDGVVTRLKLSLYNFGGVRFEAFPSVKDTPQAKKTIHQAGPDEQTTLSQQNLPLRVEVDNPDASDFDVFIADRQASLRGNFTASRRIKGERLAGVSLSGTTWAPLVTIRRKAGFEGIPIELFSMNAITADDLFLQVRSDAGSTADGDYDAPTDVSAAETAVEVDTSPSASITDGVHRFQTLFGGGQGNRTAFASVDEVDVGVKGTHPMTVFARLVSGSGGTLSAYTMNWAEDW